MSRLQHARSFRYLIVYQKARAVAKHVFELTKRFSREEMSGIGRMLNSMIQKADSFCGEPPFALRESA